MNKTLHSLHIYFLIGVFVSLAGTVLFSACQDDDLKNISGGEQQPVETPPVSNIPVRRMLWASINSRADVTNRNDFAEYNNKILVSWRMLPGDKASTAFDLYRTPAGGKEVKLNTVPIANCTNFSDADADRNIDNTYRLCYAGSDETLETYTITAAQASQGLPYISIPLANTTGIHPVYGYAANDASVGDLDGDGYPEIILKRLVLTENTVGGVGYTDSDIRHTTLYEAYRLNGSLMWRVCSGPNIPLGNSASFAVYDFDGDGRCEVAFRTAEGTIFGDGTEIGDVNGDGKTDYRIPKSQNVGGGPEFLSVIEGTTGRELARTDYIPLGCSEDWGDDKYHRSSSYRISLGNFNGKFTSILICRGIYAKSVLEAWDFRGGKLTRQWHFDTEDGVHTNYAAQGNHSLSIGDVDNDGFDEIVYGACTIDHNGKGLNCIGYGHGDALHLGKFDPSRDGLQIWSCFETGSVGAAFRDARTGQVIWQYDDPSDVGRALVADIDPDSPGCELWWYQGNVHSCTGVDLGYTTGSTNMAIWWSGSLNRQLLNATALYAPQKGTNVRLFTINRYDVVGVNGSKGNPCWYGDLLGDWREEAIFVTSDFTTELRLFSTWHPCDYKFPWLMTDHVYEMSAINQNVGYNQPTQLGYYLGSDLLEESKKENK